MSATVRASGEKNKKRDPDFILAETAMQRAALKGREKAKRAGVNVVVLKDGGIVEESPETPAGKQS